MSGIELLLYQDQQKNILHIFTGGLGLPDRDYYFDADKENIRNNYKEYMKKSGIF